MNWSNNVLKSAVRTGSGKAEFLRSVRVEFDRHPIGEVPGTYNAQAPVTAPVTPGSRNHASSSAQNQAPKDRAASAPQPIAPTGDTA
jgi:hypothetical protein